MKTTTTEKYYTNCPNCGAVIGEYDKFCTYCGTRVVYERTFTQEDTKTSEQYSKTISPEEKKTASKIFCIIAIIFAAQWILGSLFFVITGLIAVGGFISFGFGDLFFSSGFGFDLGALMIPLLLLVIGVVVFVMLVKGLKKAFKKK